jgi:hypothetical protein
LVHRERLGVRLDQPVGDKTGTQLINYPLSPVRCRIQQKRGRGTMALPCTASGGAPCTVSDGGCVGVAHRVSCPEPHRVPCRVPYRVPCRVPYRVSCRVPHRVMCRVPHRVMCRVQHRVMLVCCESECAFAFNRCCAWTRISLQLLSMSSIVVNILEHHRRNSASVCMMN